MVSPELARPKSKKQQMLHYDLWVRLYRCNRYSEEELRQAFPKTYPCEPPVKRWSW